MTKDITVKEAKLVKGIAMGKTKQQAGLDAYDTTDPATASAIATETLKKPKVQEALQKALAKHGIDMDSAVAPIGKALRATKVQITGQGDQAFAEVVEDVDLQLKGSDRALKLMGVNQESTGNTFNFVQLVQKDKDEFGI